MNSFILGYDPFAGNFSIAQLFAFIKDNRNVIQYYTPFAGTYFLKSSETLYDLQQTFYGFFEKANFVIIEVEPSKTGGYLPNNVWSWFNSSQFPALGTVS